MFVVYLILVLANFFWLAILIQAHRSWKKFQYLREDIEPVSTPPVSVIVPARNESRILSQTLDSLLKLDYPDYEVLLIDDHSEDNTYEIAASFAARDSRLKAYRSADLEPGWFGKAWALQQGVVFAKGNWLLFTDADVIHEPSSLKIALANAQKEKLDLLSIVPHIECKTFWEKVILPAFVIILGMGRPLYKINEEGSGVAGAAGGFILVRGLVFNHLGGYQTIRDALAEDLRLAELFKFSGYRIKMLLAKNKVISTRMYESLAEISRGLSRHAFEIMNHNALKMITAILLNYLIMTGPLISLMTGLFIKNWLLVLLSLLPVLTMILLQSVVNSLMGISPLYFLSFPLATSLYGWWMFDSMVSHYFRGGNMWKGRKYRKHVPTG
jgi:hopene-associated glycosyltransferase HpnB